MTRQTLSVLVTNYNHGKYLPEALDAILSQSHQPDEIILIDDGSTDDSVEIIKQYEKKYPNIRALYNPRNMGVMHNIKRMINLSSCQYLFFGATDDIILPGLFKKSLDILKKYTSAGLCTAKSKYINSQGDDKGICACPLESSKEIYLSRDQVFANLDTVGQWFIGNTAIYKKESIVAMGEINDDLAAYWDGFYMSTIALMDGACFIPEVLSAWRKMEGGLASQANINFSHSVKIQNRIVELMSTTYQDIYPKRYIEKWKRNNISMLYTEKAVRKYNEGINKIEERGETDKTIIFMFNNYITRHIIKLVYYVKMVYILLRYRHPIFKIIKKKYFG